MPHQIICHIPTYLITGLVQQMVAHVTRQRHCCWKVTLVQANASTSGWILVCTVSVMFMEDMVLVHAAVTVYTSSQNSSVNIVSRYRLQDKKLYSQLEQKIVSCLEHPHQFCDLPSCLLSRYRWFFARVKVIRE